jgi:DNA-binding MarR family transcriptional regulator
VFPGVSQSGRRRQTMIRVRDCGFPKLQKRSSFHTGVCQNGSGNVVNIYISCYDIYGFLSCYDIIRGMETLTLSDYTSLAELRYQIRCFLSFSEQAARAAGLEPRQHQLMLSLKGLPPSERPTIGELAERLQIQHHSAVELVNRLTAAGYVRRRRAGDDRREVLLALTAKGEKVLQALSLHHRAELRSAGPALVLALRRAMRGTVNSNGLHRKAVVRKGRRSS